MRQYKGGIVVKTALLLAPLLYQRPGNLRMMEWSELDLRRGLWTIPSAKMKRTVKEKEQGEDHVVPLPRQAITLLEAIQPLTGHRQYVFTNERSYDRPISDNSVRTALYSLGFSKEQSWHGFRARARVNRVGEGKKHDLIIDYNGILKNVCKGLESEEQLAIFDLLPKDSLTKGERDAIKKVAKELLDKLTSDKLQIDHWREKATAQAQVKAEIIKHLFAHLSSGAYDAGEINLKFVRIYTAGFSDGPKACH